jgi:hypothetical protein
MQAPVSPATTSEFRGSGRCARRPLPLSRHERPVEAGVTGSHSRGEPAFRGPRRPYLHSQGVPPRQWECVADKMKLRKFRAGVANSHTLRPCALGSRSDCSSRRSCSVRFRTGPPLGRRASRDCCSPRPVPYTAASRPKTSTRSPRGVSWRNSHSPVGTIRFPRRTDASSPLPAEATSGGCRRTAVVSDCSPSTWPAPPGRRTRVTWPTSPPTPRAFSSSAWSERTARAPGHSREVE